MALAKRERAANDLPHPHQGLSCSRGKRALVCSWSVQRFWLNGEGRGGASLARQPLLHQRRAWVTARPLAASQPRPSVSNPVRHLALRVLEGSSLSVDLFCFVCTHPPPEAHVYTCACAHTVVQCTRCSLHHFACCLAPAQTPWLPFRRRAQRFVAPVVTARSAQRSHGESPLCLAGRNAT